MAGGGPAIRVLYDLLMYWTVALISVMIAKPLRLPPLLFYLIFGCILGNLSIVDRSDSIHFFAEFSITMVFFALGFEETVDNFVAGIKRSYGIALIGGLVPFGCGYIIGIAFFPDEGWWVHVMLATAVTAKPVSLTMMVLQSVGLLRSRAAMCIMTTAVLDDVACLIGVGILVPIAIAAGPEPKAAVDPYACPDPQWVNGVLQFATDTATNHFQTAYQNYTHWKEVQYGVAWDIGDVAQVHPTQIDIKEFNPDTLTVTFAVLVHGVVGMSVDNLRSLMTAAAWTHTEDSDSNLKLGYRNAFNVSDIVIYDPVEEEAPSKGEVTAWSVIWIVLKVVIFFVIIYILHKVVLPHDIKEGILSKIPGVRSIGAKHLLQIFNGTQVPLICVTFGLATGMLAAALGFHPAIGSYFGGLILDEKYFDVEIPISEEEKKRRAELKAQEDAEKQTGTPTQQELEDTQKPAATSNEPVEEEGQSPVQAYNYDGFEKKEDEDDDEGVEVKNTMKAAEENIGTAAFMYLGPTFFVNLGASVIIRMDLIKTALPQALGIYAILVTGQFSSAVIGAYYFPRGFSWHESVLVGLGMLGRAELFFVVMNIAREAELVNDDVFFPMAVAAMLMNCTLPITISLWEPRYRKRHPTDDEEEPQSPSSEQPHTHHHVIHPTYRGVGVDGYEADSDGHLTPRESLQRNQSFVRHNDGEVSLNGSFRGSRAGSVYDPKQPSRSTSAIVRDHNDAEPSSTTVQSLCPHCEMDETKWQYCAKSGTQHGLYSGRYGQ